MGDWWTMHAHYKGCTIRYSWGPWKFRSDKVCLFYSSAGPGRVILFFFHCLWRLVRDHAWSLYGAHHQIFNRVIFFLSLPLAAIFFSFSFFSRHRRSLFLLTFYVILISVGDFFLIHRLGIFLFFTHQVGEVILWQNTSMPPTPWISNGVPLREQRAVCV